MSSELKRNFTNEVTHRTYWGPWGRVRGDINRSWHGKC